jgi:hypothetical protein
MNVDDLVRGREVTVVRNGFKVIITLEFDEDGSYLVEMDFGRFTEVEENDAVPHEPENPRTYNWFVPANVPNLEEFFEEYNDKEKAKEERQKYIMEQYEQACSYCDEWHYSLITCRVFLEKEELSDILLHTEVLGGVYTQFYGPHGYLEETVSDVVHAALHDAEAKLAKLTEYLTETVQ